MDLREKILYFICTMGLVLLIMIFIVNAKVYTWLYVLLAFMVFIDLIPFCTSSRKIST